MKNIKSKAEKLIQEGKFFECIQDFRKKSAEILEINAENILFYAENFLIFMYFGHFKEAKKLTNLVIEHLEAINIVPQHELCFQIGKILLFSKEYDKALRFFDLAISKTTQNEEEMLYLTYSGITYYYMKYDIEAENIFKEIISDKNGKKLYLPYYFLEKMYLEKVKKWHKVYETQLKKASEQEVLWQIEFNNDFRKMFNQKELLKNRKHIRIEDLPDSLILEDIWETSNFVNQNIPELVQAIDNSGVIAKNHIYIVAEFVEDESNENNYYGLIIDRTDGNLYEYAFENQKITLTLKNPEELAPSEAIYLRVLPKL